MVRRELLSRFAPADNEDTTDFTYKLDPWLDLISHGQCRCSHLLTLGRRVGQDPTQL